MQGACQDSVGVAYVESAAALWLLGGLAAFFRRPFEAELILKRFAPPFDLPALIELLEALGLKAGLAAWPTGDWKLLPLPAVALLVEPQPDGAVTSHAAGPPRQPALTPALIVQHDETSLSWVRPGQFAPQTLLLAAARAQSAPFMLLVAEADPPLSDSKRPRVLIFDEAISNLDQETAEHFAQTVNRLKGKVTMIFITHQVPKGLQVDEVVNMGRPDGPENCDKEPT